MNDVHVGSSVVFRISSAGAVIVNSGVSDSYRIRLPAACRPARQS